MVCFGSQTQGGKMEGADESWAMVARTPKVFIQ